VDRIEELEARVERMGDLNAVLIAGLAAAVSQLRDSRSICTMNWHFDVESVIRDLPVGDSARREESLQHLMKVIADISASHHPEAQ
jgi:hypothetical protein